MARTTNIEWCDSTLNLMMGCDGCELRNLKAGVNRCYAGTLTDRYAGHNSGFPAAFEEPKQYPERLAPALRWSDLTGTNRPDKPWLDGLPRMIFLDDMGDTFTESLPLDWMAQHLPAIAKSKHVWMLLTKRPSRMRKFSEKYPLPANVWPGTSVTTQKSTSRIDDLLAVQGGGVKWISAEPLWESVNLERHLKIPPILDFVIVGGESGTDAKPCNIQWIRSIIEQCKAFGKPVFVKQLGSNPRDDADADIAKLMFPNGVPPGVQVEGVYQKRSTLSLDHSKGGEPSEWPADLRVRCFPNV